MTEPAPGTRTALLRAAEQLLAVGGLAGPSDREIIAAARVRNKSAIGYHFGSRRGLIDAILTEHGEVLRVRRALAFEELTVDRATDDLFRLCRVMIEPNASFLAEGPSQWAYLAVSQSVMEDPEEEPVALPVRFGDPLLPGLVDLMLARIPLPPAVAEERALVGFGQAIASIGARARQQLAGPGARSLSATELFTANLLDMLHGAITAPASPAALRAAAASASGASGV